MGDGGFTRTVAIKRLHRECAQAAEFSSMLVDEARLAARIRHRNVVATLDAIAEDGELLLIMEYIVGESVAGLVAECTRLGERVPFPFGLRIAADALYGLDAAHRATGENQRPLFIVHRDVSPQNILVGIDGMARVLDFGIAKAASRVQTTRDGQLKGKLRYMAPEQFQDGPVTARTDVYGLSVTLWELLTGQKLFDASSDGAIMAKILTSTIVKPSRLAPQLPAVVDEIVLRGLARDPAERFASARDMAVALESTGMLAFPRELGDWVCRVAERRLEARAAAVSAVELGAGGFNLPQAAASPPTHTQTLTLDPPESRSPVANAASWRRWIGPGVVTALLFAIVVGVSNGAVREVHHQAAPEPPRAASATGATGSIQSEVNSSDALPSEPLVVASATSQIARPVPPPPSQARRPPEAPKRSCSPPYIEDSMGIRHIKPECMTRR